MTKKAKFFCRLILIVLAAVLAFSAPASAGRAKDMKPGTWTGDGGHRWLRFGKYTWRVLRVDAQNGRKEALLLTEELVDKRRFNGSRNYDWATSDIKGWLNGGFYNSAFSDGERNAILTAHYRYGGKYDGYDKADSSKIFLLSTNEAWNKSYFSGDGDRVARGETQGWWLRSPGSNSLRAAYVYSNGYVSHINHDAVDSSYGVRPALILNLLSPIFTSSSSQYEVLYNLR